MSEHNHELAADIRDDIRGELEAISQYTKHAYRTDDREARQLLLHVADEERHHFMRLLKLLTRIDPEQCRAFYMEFGRATPATYPPVERYGV